MKHPTTRSRLRAVAAAAGSLLAMGALLVVDGAPAGSTPARRAGVVWDLSWKAPVTEQGPNRFDRPLSLAGTVRYALGEVDRVDATITAPAGLPAACGTFPRTVAAKLAGATFTIEPALACNATYAVSVVAQEGSGALAARSPTLRAPATLADPGAPVGGLGGVVQGSTRTVSLSWASDADPDVVGYRVRRDGIGVADVPANVRTHADVVPAPGTYQYDVVTLRWGGGGPGSAPVASAPTDPLRTTVVPDAPATPIAPSSTGRPSGGGGSTGATTPKSGGASPKLPPEGSATAKVPTGRTAGARPRTTYRSGGTIPGSITATTIDDGYEEDLPYEPGTSREAVEPAGPAGSRTVSRSVPVSTRSGPGLLVPAAVVVVLLAGSLQVRSLLGRAAAARGGIDVEIDEH